MPDPCFILKEKSNHPQKGWFIVKGSGNSSYSGSGSRKLTRSKPAWAKLTGTYLKNKI
jgi:hypothetical protein